MEGATETEKALFEAMTDVLDEANPTMGEAIRVLTYLLAAVVHSTYEDDEYPEVLLELLQGAYAFASEQTDDLLN